MNCQRASNPISSSTHSTIVLIGSGIGSFVNPNQITAPSTRLPFS